MSERRSQRIAVVAALVPLALAAAAHAQAPNDDCSAAVPIAGNGVHAFDSSQATPGPQSPVGGFCPFTGNDVWFRWTAGSSGLATLHTCGQVAHDSAIAVYAGSTCPTPGTAIACDDDACGLESLVTFAVQSGATYLFQIGSSSVGPGGPGTITIDVQAPPSNDDCGNALFLGSQTGANYDASVATTSPQGLGHPGCPDVTYDLWYVWVAPQSGSATLDTCFQSGLDTAVKVYAGAGCPLSPPIACNDDGCDFQSSVTWPIAAGDVFLLEVGTSGFAPTGPGSFVITLAGNPSSGTTFCAGDGTGAACPCGNSGPPGAGCAHASGSGARLEAFGPPSVAYDGLLLLGSQMPANSPALYFQGTSQAGGGLGLPFGDGLRCAAGTIVRLGTEQNQAGSSSHGAPAGDGPVSVTGGIPPAGGTRVYQIWFRNAAAFCTSATFNTSNGVQVVWVP